MISSRVLFAGSALFVVLKLFSVRDFESAVGGTVGVLVTASMMWFSDFWATYILPFGFWASKASDYRSPGNSEGAIILLAWVFLALIAYSAYMV